jgi:hypothetical protein
LFLRTTERLNLAGEILEILALKIVSFVEGSIIFSVLLKTNEDIFAILPVEVSKDDLNTPSPSISVYSIICE